MIMNINENHTTSKSQEKKILDWMLAGLSITQLEALTLFGCSRLSARIGEIKAKGYIVYSEYITTTTGKRVKSYHM